nr:aminotransferase class I/II-fold pyridoxal phosphate-dependent enzyme [uncultured Draconibacterium sp.]
MQNKIFTPKDFIDVPDKDIYATADYFQLFIDQMDRIKSNAFDITSTTAIGSKMDIIDRYSSNILKTTSFVSNNYLGMNRHPKVIEAAQKAMKKYGIGTCASPVIGGATDIHSELAHKISRLHGQEDAILYPSGYAANIGVFQLLLNKMDIAIVDMFVHASVYDGLIKTNIKIFKHNDTEYLESVLKRTQGTYRNIAVIVDGVYSQDGDLSRMVEICNLAKKYGAYMFVDDAHGAGVFGQNGKGTVNHFGLEDKVDLITGTLSKSMGTCGGYATGKKQLIKYMKHFSRSNTFSASVAPPLVAAASKAIDLFSEEPQIIQTLWENTRYIKTQLKERGFDIGRSESPIIPVMIRDDEKTKVIARELLKNGIYIIPATYPAVKLKDSRLRLNITAQHTTEDLDKFCETLSAINKTLIFTN